MSSPFNGNPALESTVKNIIASGKIPHAFIIEGDEGKERFEIAKFIATACVCEGDNKPCGKCKQCHLAELGNHVDIITVAPQDGKKNISVLQVRGVRADAYIKPRLQEKKVFIFEQANRMNEQGQNSLLKVLEEPPKNVVFILLTTSRNLLLDTVISRCTLLALPKSQVSKKQADLRKVAQSFIDCLFNQDEYEMLKILQKYEKNRVKTEEFFLQLKIVVAENLKMCTDIKTKAIILNTLYDDIDNYLKLLKTNVNLSLLFSAATARAKRLTE